ncbi:MAG: tyrosine--tRNA ligase [Candidatus Jorgensenbacteria bacterium]
MDPRLEKVLTRGVEHVIERDHLAAVLASKKKLRVKLGIDPTSPELHLGHTVVLRKLRQFQDLGHKAVLIIGDFTAQIGDPSGQGDRRKALTESEIKKNFSRYLAQAGKVIDVKKTEVRKNSEWHKKRGLAALLALARAVSVQQVLKREDFEKRLARGSEISLLETLYPLLQGYDSVAVRADVELGGTDQTFNLLMGRRVQRHFKMKEQDVLTVPLIEGTDGMRKMSKSYGNAIAITATPQDMFGKLMTVPDLLIGKYFTALTDAEAPRNLNPRDQKLRLAETIVGMYHSPAAAAEAHDGWVRVFSKKETPREMPEFSIPKAELPQLDAASFVARALGVSKSEAWRLIKNPGTVHLNDRNLTDPRKPDGVKLKDGDILRIGKRHFFRVKIK